MRTNDFLWILILLLGNFAIKHKNEIIKVVITNYYPSYNTKTDYQYYSKKVTYIQRLKTPMLF